MINLMAKGMAERYEEYLHTSDVEERAAKIIYFWVMSSLQKFIEIFNNVEYPLTSKISSPVFHAHSFGVWNNPYLRKKYTGYHHVNITVNLLPEADDDSTNSGRHS